MSDYIDRKTLNQAREWAEDNLKAGYFPHGDRARAAAEVIQALPDRWIDAEKVREVIEEARLLIRDGEPEIILNDLAALFPVQRRRTLADMTPEERAECQWMQCKEAHFPTGGTGAQGIILASDETSSLILERNGAAVTWNNRLVTPLPDLPRMEWPGNEPEEAEDTASQGHPAPGDIPANEAWQVIAGGQVGVGHRNDPDDTWPWQIIYPTGGGKDSHWATDDEVALIARLVPDTGGQP